MKTTATFNELAKVFAVIAKANIKFEQQQEAEKEYSDFVDYCLHLESIKGEDVDTMIELGNKKDKTQKATKKLLKECLDLLDINKESAEYDYEDRMILDNLKSPYYFHSIFDDLKFKMRDLAKKVTYSTQF